MALELRQQQRMAQQLVMTQRLQQAIKLLPLSHLELVDAIRRELEENPTLEEAEPAPPPGGAEIEERLRAEAEARARDEAERNNGQGDGDALSLDRLAGDDAADGDRALLERLAEAEEYGSLRRSAAGPSPYEDLFATGPELRAETTLAEHLAWQLGMQDLPEDVRRAAAVIVGNLDERGWLVVSLEEVAEQAGVDLDAVAAAQRCVQELDPIGCGGRDLVEVLVAQVRILWPGDEAAERLVRDHLRDLENRNYAAIASALGIEEEDAREYHRMIRCELEPMPGRPFAQTANHAIIPDIEVRKVGGEWRVLLNEEGLPRLRVSPYYRRILQDAASRPEDRRYIKERIESADFFIKSIHKRQRTIRRVMETILRRQIDFFEHGPEHLRPMVLRDVADEIGVHESTVSRVTTNKYVQCPHGIFELKYFFNAGIRRTGGADLAAEAVRQHIRRLIAAEDPARPLSDSEIARLLRERHGIRIARRTIAKYREAMNILPSTKRKRMQ